MRMWPARTILPTGTTSPMMLRWTQGNHPRTVPRIIPDPIPINRTVRH